MHLQESLRRKCGFSRIHENFHFFRMKFWVCSSLKNIDLEIEFKILMIGFKICYELGLERHRENFILRDGANSFLERYPYVHKMHESQLYHEIKKE